MVIHNLKSLQGHRSCRLTLCAMLEHHQCCFNN